MAAVQQPLVGQQQVRWVVLAVMAFRRQSMVLQPHEVAVAVAVFLQAELVVLVALVVVALAETSTRMELLEQQILVAAAAALVVRRVFITTVQTAVLAS